MGKPQKVRQQEIIDAVLELAATKGLAKISTQHIADQVGIAQPTIFRHFKTREEIVSAAVRYVTGSLADQLAPIFESDRPAIERLETIITEHITFLSTQPGFCRVLLSDQTHLESALVKETIQGSMQRYSERLKKLIDEGKKDESISTHCDSNSLPRYIIATIQGLLLRWSLNEFNFQLSDEAKHLWKFVKANLV